MKYDIRLHEYMYYGIVDCANRRGVSWEHVKNYLTTARNTRNISSDV